MSPARLRLFNEGQVRRVLASGGMLVETDGQWRAYRTHDARRGPAGRTTPLIVNRLRAERAVLVDPERPGRLIAGCVTAPPVTSIPPPARLMRTTTWRPPVSLLAELTRELPETSAEVTRLKAAAQRFRADMDIAGALPSAARPGQSAVAAAVSRLAALEAGLSLQVFRQLESLIVDVASASAFARQFSFTGPEGRATALAALRSLAAAYDLALKPPRG